VREHVTESDTAARPTDGPTEHYWRGVYQIGDV